MLSEFASNNGYTIKSIAVKMLFLFSLNNFGSISNTPLGAVGV